MPIRQTEKGTHERSLARQDGDASQGVCGVGGTPPSVSMLLEAHLGDPRTPFAYTFFLLLHILLMSRQTRRVRKIQSGPVWRVQEGDLSGTGSMQEGANTGVGRAFQRVVMRLFLTGDRAIVMQQAPQPIENRRLVPACRSERPWGSELPVGNPVCSSDLRGVARMR